MIIKPIRNGKRSSAKDMARYNEHGSLKEERAAKKQQGVNYIPKGKLVLTNKVNAIGYEKIAEQLEEVANDFYNSKPNTKLQNPFFSSVISFDKEDIVTDEMLEDILKGYAEFMGFSEHQYCIWEHNDKEHRHFHILMNRINPENETIWEDSHSKVRGVEYAKFVEKKYPNLRQVKRAELIKSKVPKQTLNQKRKISKNTYSSNSYTNQIKYKILQSLAKSKNIQELKEKLKTNNITIKDGFGMVFIDNTTGKSLNYKQLGNEFSRKEILNTLQNNEKFGLQQNPIKEPPTLRENTKTNIETENKEEPPLNLGSGQQTTTEKPQGPKGKRTWETEEEAEKRRKKGVR